MVAYENLISELISSVVWRCLERWSSGLLWYGVGAMTDKRQAATYADCNTEDWRRSCCIHFECGICSRYKTVKDD